MEPCNAEEYFPKHSSHAPELNTVSKSKLSASTVWSCNDYTQYTTTHTLARYCTEQSRVLIWAYTINTPHTKPSNFQHFQFHRNINASYPHERRGSTEGFVGHSAQTYIRSRPAWLRVLATSVKVVFKFNTDGSQTSGQLLWEYATQHAWFHR